VDEGDFHLDPSRQLFLLDHFDLEYTPPHHLFLSQLDTLYPIVLSRSLGVVLLVEETLVLPKQAISFVCSKTEPDHKLPLHPRRYSTRPHPTGFLSLFEHTKHQLRLLHHHLPRSRLHRLLQVKSLLRHLDHMQQRFHFHLPPSPHLHWHQSGPSLLHGEHDLDLHLSESLDLQVEVELHQRCLAGMEAGMSVSGADGDTKVERRKRWRSKRLKRLLMYRHFFLH
jgi:hypothetical protein